MDIAEFINSSSFDRKEVSFPTDTLEHYYSRLFEPLGFVSTEDFFAAAVLNFSVQQLSNRSAFAPRDSALLHFSARPVQLFPAALLKAVERTEAHLFPLAPLSTDLRSNIASVLETAAPDELMTPYIHSSEEKAEEILSEDGHFGLLHIVEADDAVLKETVLRAILCRLQRFSDVLVINSAESLSRTISDAGFLCAAKRIREKFSLYLFRREDLPEAGVLPKPEGRA